MKKYDMLKLLALPMAAALLLGLAACSSKNATTPTASGSANTGVTYGKVTAIDGSKITLDMGTINTPSRQNPQGTPSSPSGTPSQDKQRGGMGITFTSDGESKTITISDTSILKKQQRENAGPGNGFPNASPNASPKASVSPRPTMDPSRTPGANDGPGGNLAAETAASLSDITVGSILRITYQGATITSIVIMSL